MLLTTNHNRNKPYHSYCPSPMTHSVSSVVAHHWWLWQAIELEHTHTRALHITSFLIGTSVYSNFLLQFTFFHLRMVRKWTTIATSCPLQPASLQLTAHSNKLVRHCLSDWRSLFVSSKYVGVMLFSVWPSRRSELPGLSWLRVLRQILK